MKIPSPCIDICKYKLNGHCTGCYMTRKQKKQFKTLNSFSEKRIFLSKLITKQIGFDGSKKWQTSYRRKCNKRGLNYEKLIT
ncbi:MAG: DUF1289 domain-containing protein [Paracoccaceae bacterium]|nr:DUF1289 domain-containing protein [Paracoccaceae bacterium]